MCVALASAGQFKSPVLYTVGNEPQMVVAAGFRNNGTLDLATADFSSNDMSILLGNGDGTFGNPQNVTVPEPERVLVLDANGDAYPDIAALAYCGRNVSLCKSGAVAILLNNGSGKFAKPKYYSVKGTGPDGIAAADLNHDGKLDLVVANNNFQQPSTVSILLGNGDGTFGRAHHVAVGDGPAGVTIADFNGDGNADAAVANTASATLTLLPGKGTGKFKAPQTITFNSGSLPVAVTAADFDKNGATDLAVALSYANEVAVLINKR